MLRLHSWVGNISSGAFTERETRSFSSITTLTRATLAYLKQVCIVNLAVYVQDSSLYMLLDTTKMCLLK